jgi:hypothetical protein
VIVSRDTIVQNQDHYGNSGCYSTALHIPDPVHPVYQSDPHMNTTTLFRTSLLADRGHPRLVGTATHVLKKLLCPLLAVMWVLCVGALAGEKSDSPQPVSRTDRKIEGWTVRVDDRLLAPPHDTLGARALKLLEAKLADITYVVATEHLEQLQAVTIVLDLTHGELHAMQYHPDAGWLESHGYSRDLEKCVHIPEAADLPTRRTIREQPWVVLHELAHAYHDQVLGFDEPRIREAYERFKKSGHGDVALLHDGQRVRHYGLTDHKEFFAEMTEAYFGMNDFFPFNRAELMTAEPEIYELLRTIWEPGT